MKKTIPVTMLFVCLFVCGQMKAFKYEVQNKSGRNIGWFVSYMDNSRSTGKLGPDNNWYIPNSENAKEIAIWDKDNMDILSKINLGEPNLRNKLKSSDGTITIWPLLPYTGFEIVIEKTATKPKKPLQR